MARTFGDFNRMFFGPGKPGEALLCPSCGLNNLHHFRVTVFDRTEDAPQTIVTEVENGRVARRVVPSEQSKNPSSRRHGLAIGFTCETCPEKPELTLEQHKGETFIGWRDTAPAGSRQS